MIGFNFEINNIYEIDINLLSKIYVVDFLSASYSVFESIFPLKYSKRFKTEAPFQNFEKMFTLNLHNIDTCLVDEDDI